MVLSDGMVTGPLSEDRKKIKQIYQNYLVALKHRATNFNLHVIVLSCIMGCRQHKI